MPGNFFAGLTSFTFLLPVATRSYCCLQYIPEQLITLHNHQRTHFRLETAQIKTLVKELLHLRSNFCGKVAHATKRRWYGNICIKEALQFISFISRHESITTHKKERSRFGSSL